MRPRRSLAGHARLGAEFPHPICHRGRPGQRTACRLGAESLGFGAVEVGTVDAAPQPGNPKPAPLPPPARTDALKSPEWASTTRAPRSCSSNSPAARRPHRGRSAQPGQEQGITRARIEARATTPPALPGCSNEAERTILGGQRLQPQHAGPAQPADRGQRLEPLSRPLLEERFAPVQAQPLLIKPRARPRRRGPSSGAGRAEVGRGRPHPHPNTTLAGKGWSRPAAHWPGGRPLGRAAEGALERRLHQAHHVRR